MAGERGLARKIRTRLDSEPDVTTMNPVVGQKKDVLDELSFNKPIRQHVKEFGALFGAIGFGVAAFLLYRHGVTTGVYAFSAVAVVFSLLGYAAPKLLYPVWKAWMALAHVLGGFMNMVILTIAWLIVIIPIAILLKIIGKKVMDLRYGAPVDSYWEVREEKLHDFKLLDRQF